MLARRMRQHPREFGPPPLTWRPSNFLNRRILRTFFARHQFLRDRRGGIQAGSTRRTIQAPGRQRQSVGFSWPGAGRRRGFPYLLFADQCGQVLERCRAKPGLGWLRLLPDLPVVIGDISTGYLKLGSYWNSLKSTRVESVFYLRDLLPSLGELALLPYLITKKYGKRKI